MVCGICGMDIPTEFLKFVGDNIAKAPTIISNQNLETEIFSKSRREVRLPWYLKK